MVQIMKHRMMKKKDIEYFNYCYNSALDFIHLQYKEQSSNKEKLIYTHVTTATDRDNINKVFLGRTKYCNSR